MGEPRSTLTTSYLSAAFLGDTDRAFATATLVQSIAQARSPPATL
jgi:hypothetical protein